MKFIINRRKRSKIRRVKVARKIFLKGKEGFHKRPYLPKDFMISSLLLLLTKKTSLNSKISVLQKNKAFKIVKNQVETIKIQLKDNFIKYMQMKLPNQITLLRNGMKTIIHKSLIKYQKDKIEKGLTLKINNKINLVMNLVLGEVTKVWCRVKKINHFVR